MEQRGFWTPTKSMVLTYWFAWGFSSLDRLLIAILFPFVMPFFNLNFTQAGLLMTCMSIGYVVFAVVGGALSDKYGRKKVIIPAVLIFSLGSFFTGLAKNFGQLIGIRSVIGAAEGVYFPAAVAQISEQSSSATRGLNLGIHQSGMPIWGMFVAPIFGTQIAALLGWQWAFYLTIIPGIILALVVRYKVKETERYAVVEPTTKVSWKEVIKEKNVILCLITSIFWMVWVWSWLSFGTMYLTNIKGFSPEMAGAIQSAFGIGGGLGMIIVPALSDRWGRKTMMIVSTIIAILATLGVLYIAGQNLVLLYLLLGIAAFAGWGSGPVFLAALATESVPFERAALSVGLIAGIGELAGAAVAPTVLGRLADLYNLNTSMLVAVLCLVPVLVVSFALRETAPKLIKVKQDTTLAG